MGKGLDVGKANSVSGLLAVAKAVEGGAYLNGTRFPSRDDLAVFAHLNIEHAEAVLKEKAGVEAARNVVGWYRSIERLLGGKFAGGDYKGVAILPREPLPPAPERVASAQDLDSVVEPGSETAEGGSWPPLPSAERKNVLITSALPYVNNEPHLGNIIGCVLSADVYARFCRARKYNTLFVCGTDEYGTATETKAFQEKMTCEEICNKYHALHSKIYKWFGILFDEFGRTSTHRQTRVAQEIFDQVHSNGKIKEQTMEQLYSEALGRFLADRLVEGTCPKCGYEDARGDQCDQCGSLLSPTELINPKCKLTGTEPKMKKTDHLFLDLTQVESRLQDWINWRGKGEGMWSSNCQRITDTWMKDGLHPRCITRDLKWGTLVPLQGYTNKVFYVWFDAPIGYISITASLFAKRMHGQGHGAPTTIGEGKEDDEVACYGPDAAWRQWWQCGDSEQGTCGSQKPKVDLIQFMGKDNIPFHTIMFPSTLIGTATSPEQNPWTIMKSISVTEYLTYEGDKFSKSRSRGVFGSDAEATGIPADVWRYTLLASRPEANDSDFKWQDLANRCNGELLANLGNFVNRTLSFAHARFGGCFPSLEDMWGASQAEQAKDCDPAENECDDELGEAVQPLVKSYVEAMEKMQMREGLKLVLACSKVGNQFFQEKQPWVLIKDVSTRPACARAIASCIGLVRILACLMQPFMPATSASILRQMKLPKTCYVIDEHLLNGARYPSRLIPLGTAIDKPEVLFETIPEDRIKDMKSKFAGAAAEGSGEKKSEKKKKKKPATGKGGSKGNAKVDISRLELVVGKILEVAKHPNAESLYVEKIDLGGERGVVQVVSGLVNKINLEDHIGSLVLLVANAKASTMRGETSQAMLLCAAEESKFELVIPPTGAKTGDRVFAEGFDGEADEILSSKVLKKVLDLPDGMATNEDCQVVFQGRPIQLGPGSVCSVASLKGARVR